ncbi:hypothetical protein TIFTF001_046683 [Ficus carica]|uniref:Retrotransposon gag domain-containing protein n=1 Tax=Ficus carica TaxID=3494 RepID=A0AA88CVB8_FICCA|nr:hypothetical protein TIFTF001_046683 [Ficus carica]
MADEREHQEELSQGSPVNNPEASTSGAKCQITNLTQFVEELTRKYSTQQTTSECPIPPGTMNIEEMMRTFMSEEMRTFEAQMEQRFSSQIHRATTSTPGYDDLTRGVRETPPYKAHYQHHHSEVRKHFLSESLKGAALRWFCNLPPESIDSFHEHSLEFMRNFSVHIQLGKTTKDLWGVVHGPHESLRAYVKRFSKAISEISGLDVGIAREALKKGFIELEEENERVERDWARTREEVVKVRNEREKTFRRERTHPAQRTEHREGRTTRRDHKRPLSPSKYALGISPLELIAHLKRQDFVTWPKKLQENLARDTTKYCEFY